MGPLFPIDDGQLESPGAPLADAAVNSGNRLPDELGFLSRVSAHGRGRGCHGGASPSGPQAFSRCGPKPQSKPASSVRDQPFVAVNP